ncbi:MAG: hypothetical protein WC346_09725 [Methanogenium sp.]|jgi:hypothetical protein
MILLNMTIEFDDSTTSVKIAQRIAALYINGWGCGQTDRSWQLVSTAKRYNEVCDVLNHYCVPENAHPTNNIPALIYSDTFINIRSDCEHYRWGDKCKHPGVYNICTEQECPYMRCK